MIILGLTGSMAMGKSTIARMLKMVFHVPLWDADQAVRNLLQTDLSLIQEIAKRYPETMKGDTINRAALRALAFDDPSCLATLEQVIHQKALSSAIDFLKKMKQLQVPLCALDVPLLFEVGWDQLCTHTLVVYAPAFIQMQRIQRRPDMTETRIATLLSRYWDLGKKKSLATYEIQTGLSKGYAFQQLDGVMRDMTGRDMMGHKNAI